MTFNMWNKLLQNIKDIFFPIGCVECGMEGEWWCVNCRKKLNYNIIGSCPVCGQTTDGTVCFNCRDKSDLDGAIALFEYSENLPVGKLIKLYKYSFVRDIDSLWSDLIKQRANNFKFRFDNSNGAVIVPVPLHARRERERGFNQAENIAKILSEVLALPMENNFLKRIKYTSQQARLARVERFANLQDAFVFTGVAPRQVILVDDVFTTGATMQSCARVLKNAGVKNVWGFTLARGQ